jgi:hypothetical protein
VALRHWPFRTVALPLSILIVMLTGCRCAFCSFVSSNRSFKTRSDTYDVFEKRVYLGKEEGFFRLEFCDVRGLRNGGCKKTVALDTDPFKAKITMHYVKEITHLSHVYVNWDFASVLYERAWYIFFYL